MVYLTSRRGSNIQFSSGTWMAALRLTKAEGCGVDFDDEVPPVKPSASFHASHANANTLDSGRIIQARSNLTCSFDLTCAC